MQNAAVSFIANEFSALSADPNMERLSTMFSILRENIQSSLGSCGISLSKLGMSESGQMAELIS